ncbi:nuclease-related domain-containing protein [Microbacterium sp. XT11]|uniref:nuclease-related domain-containing protein n=1 Tax=Microbacterium sp. XT11 TaxID=367477 RepID=UPI0008309D81|nr:nuclease-related domain-containing protein [Microbacterium sp. XT11]
MQPLLIAFIGVLLLALAAMILGHARARNSWRLQRDAEAEAHSSLTAELERAHAEALRERDADHDAALATQSLAHWHKMRNAERRHEEKLAELETELTRKDAVLTRALAQASTGIKWELASRSAIVAACETADIDAIVATNIVFVPDEDADDVFCAQVDHLVLSPNAALLIDSKRWNGLVFDGVRPSTRAQPLAALFDESAFTGSFALHLTPRGKETRSIDVRTYLDADAPAQRARLQAIRLLRYLRLQAAALDHIDTCVFYSHPDATVVTSGYDGSGRFRTHIAHTHTLAGVLQRVHSGGDGGIDPQQLTRVASVIRRLGADLVGTGRYASEYTSPIPLTKHDRLTAARPS